MAAYIEDYGGDFGGRRRRKSNRRPARTRSPGYDDWRSVADPAQFNSPYRASKPDIQSSESRTSSREWSRTDSSLRAATSTMPSSLHTSRSSHRRGAGPPSVHYRLGKGRSRVEPNYDDYDEEEEDDDGDYVEIARPVPARRGGFRRSPSPRPSARRSKPAHYNSPHPPRMASRARSSRRSLSGSELSEEDEDDNDDQYDNDSISESASEGSEISEEDEPIPEQKMPTIPEDDVREKDRLKDRMRSRSTPRHPPRANEDYREEAVLNEPERVPEDPPPPQPPMVDEKDGVEPEIHAAVPPHPEASPEAAEHVAHEDHGRSPRRRSHKAKTRHLEEERDAKYGHSRRKSRHAPDIVDEEDSDLDRPRRPHYPREEQIDDRDFKRRSHHSRHDHRSRPASPPAPVYRSYSPERSRVGTTTQKHRRRRSSMDDVKPKKHYQSVVNDHIYATPPRRTNTSGPNMASSHSVSTSKRPPSFLGNIFGLSSSHHQASQPKKPVRQVECVVCMDGFPSNELPKLKCGHRMCASCLQRSFKLSLTDPSHMPPKCCGQDQIPLAHVNDLFDKKFKLKWNQKLTEYTMKNPTWCPAKNCNALLMPADIRKRKGYRNKMGTCPRCHTEVCVTCKSKWHGGKHCPNDPDANKLLEKAKQEGWQMQKCHKCKNLVELKEGCNHMKCRCGAEFCMLCGLKWKKCDCPWFNYDNIEDDGLDYLNIERPPRDGNPFAPAGGRVPPPPFAPPPQLRRPAPPVGAGPQPARPMSSHRPGSSHRAAPPPDFESEMRPRRRRGNPDADRRRRRQIGEPYESEYELVDDDMQDVVGVGNNASHFVDDDYTRAAPVAPPMDSHPSLPRAATVGTAIPEHPRHKLRRRPSSLERRLADRFDDSHARSIPVRPSGSHTAPPGPHSHLGAPAPHMGPASALGTTHVPPMAHPPPKVGRRRRRRTLGEEVYPEPYDEPYEEEVYRAPIRVSRRRGAPEPLADGYIEEPFENHRRRSEPPKSSVMAGLTGDGRGMNRVFEWRTHVEPGCPDDAIVA